MANFIPLANGASLFFDIGVIVLPLSTGLFEGTTF